MAWFDKATRPKAFGSTMVVKPKTVGLAKPWVCLAARFKLKRLKTLFILLIFFLYFKKVNINPP